MRLPKDMLILLSMRSGRVVVGVICVGCVADFVFDSGGGSHLLCLVTGQSIVYLTEAFVRGSLGVDCCAVWRPSSSLSDSSAMVDSRF